MVAAKKVKETKEVKKQAPKEAPEKTSKLKLRRGWMMNLWEKWLANYFVEDPGPVSQLALVEEISPYIEEHGGPADRHSVVRNSIRRLVNNRWVTRKKRGHFIRGARVDVLKDHKVEVGQAATEARIAKGMSRQDVADLLGHRSKGRYATLEQGRTHMHVWEAHLLVQAFEVDIVEAALGLVEE
jgi:hypothetical protein